MNNRKMGLMCYKFLVLNKGVKLQFKFRKKQILQGILFSWASLITVAWNY